MDLIPFSCHGIAIQEACWFDGKPYFTGQAVGELLGYKEPRKAINKIVERNPHINDPRWSVDVNLTSTDGKKYTIRVYNPIALQLITFESRQPKAIQYKIAVANLVWTLITGKLKPSKWTQKDDLVSAARQILSLPSGKKRGALVRDLAKRDNVSLQAAYRSVQRATGKRLRTRIRSDKGTTKNPGERAAAITYIKEHPGATAREIKVALGLQISISRIRTWARELRLEQSDGYSRSVNG